MSEDLSLAKIEDNGQTGDLLVVTRASSDQKPLDQNPAAVYLKKGRFSGDIGILRGVEAYKIPLKVSIRQSSSSSIDLSHFQLLVPAEDESSSGLPKKPRFAGYIGV